MKKIYLDNNATTPIDKEVIKIINKQRLPLNPSSIHSYGREAKKLLIKAKKQIGLYFNVNPDCLIFTSGGTEAVNLAIRGIIENYPNSHIVATDIDHVSVYNTLKYLEGKNFKITYIKAGRYGALTPAQIEKNIRKDTRLIVVSAVNSETGVKTDINQIAKIAKEKDVFLAVDGVALLGKENFSIPSGVTTMAFSSHKIHGPQGVGLCFVEENARISPLLFGGSQENEKRAGTENLPNILGFAKAIDLLSLKLPLASQKMLKLRNYFETTLINKLGVSVNGEGERICNISNICFKNIDAESLLILLDQKGVLASHGSACSSGSMTISRVLLNMGISPKDARSSIRFSFSRYNTFSEVKKAVDIILKEIDKLY